MAKTEKPYVPAGGRSGMQSDKAPIPKPVLRPPAPAKVKRIGS
jgi:hypothetical protein